MDRIEDTDKLLRRIPFTNPSYIKPDGSITSLAFKPKKGDDGLSVNIARRTTYEASVLDRSRFRLYGVQAAFPRGLGLECVTDPLPENPAHALIKGNITDAVSRKLSHHAELFPDPQQR